jgi:hypothetical protein
MSADETIYTIIEKAAEIQTLARELLTAAVPPPTAPIITDLRATMPYNSSPDEPWLKQRNRTDWWLRRPDQIGRITIHHIGSNASAQQVADYITRPRANGGKGLPRTQYHYHITPTGEILYLLDLAFGPWHDSGSDQNTGISIGMGGALHLRKPPLAQLKATVDLTAWLMAEFAIPPEMVNGHDEWARHFVGKGTQCPGWTQAGWRGDFFNALGDVLPQPARAVSFSAEVADLSASMLELDDLARGD